MARSLDVHFHRILCGRLTQDKGWQITFAYNSEWLESREAMPLSQSLPLRTAPYKQRECRGFFGGTLPEQTQRDVIAKLLGISKQNDFSMLELIGGECAGAVTFVPRGAELPQAEHDFRIVNPSELAALIRQLPRQPLLAGEDGVRLSLAGAQSKLALHIENGVTSIPLGGAPSTHILKPRIPQFEGIVFNEFLCMKLAQAIGLSVAEVEVTEIEDIECLLIKRYDREQIVGEDGATKILRLHQEDFCQALNVPSETKYQNEGGPSLADCFRLIREVMTVPAIALQEMLDAVIFSFLIGNHDAHGKNFAILYAPTGEGIETGLAPFYDLVCTALYGDFTSKMAMKIGGEYDSKKVFGHHFERFAEEAGLSKPAVMRRLAEMAKELPQHLVELEFNETSAKVAEVIRERCGRALSRIGS